ncbi:Iron-binding protein isca [Mycena indigotica]|uniref:Iron-sulfur assembly protein 1 n=1 Tax=Mycena indigotica TaxID=2126181 RepID=A0A8H6SY19_9AGAR|nr:Iron-binding protein isca [Mycena indigotica]KAF7306432.1 Iron-binding protein isca [Mycena indigotica]
MAAVARLQHASRFSSLPFLYPCLATVSANASGSTRRAMMSAYKPSPPTPSLEQALPTLQSPPLVLPSVTSLSPDAAAPQTAARPPPAPKPEKPRPVLRPTKAALTITPSAVARLSTLSQAPTPQLIRIGVRNKGCAGLSYHLEYVEKPGKFDEVVEQDGVRVLIDSKALFSIIGSEMDWAEDALSAKFAFKNPNIKDACGCGESFTVGH